MTQLANTEARFVIEVRGLSGSLITGLVTANFTFDLRRESGGSLVASGETVTIQEIGTGLYWVKLTPASASERYRLVVAEGAFADSASGIHEFQFEVESGFAPVGGPYLSTRDSVKTALGITGNAEDARIDALLVSVTVFAETYCGRQFFDATYTWFAPVRNTGISELRPPNTPVAAVTSIHVSTSIPRVYGSAELLVADTDYIVDGDEIHRIGACWPAGIRTVRVVYDGGYAVIPSDLQRAAEEIIAAKLFKARDHQYHFTSFTRDDGGLAGIRFDDMPDNARMVLDFYRSWRS